MKRFGPGFLVAAAFIGPGTVTTASLAGANHGYALAWAVAFATLATIVMQEMSARLGVVAGRGLGEALRTAITRSGPRLAVAILVVVGIGIGNAAYQTGNVTGAALGLSGVSGGPLPVWTLVIGACAGLVLWTGSRERIAAVLTLLVLVMTVLFVVTALLVRPDPGALLDGLRVPHIPSGGLLTVIALVGTTVVPYNLFLHSAAAQQKWGGAETGAALRDARRDTVLAVLLGGTVTLAILLTAVPFHGSGTPLASATDMARQLEPLLGTHARWAFALGLFAAGFTSAVTAPLAAAWAVGGVLGWPRDLAERRNRRVWLGVLVIGTVLASVGRRPLEAIVVAQAANGLLLPLMAGFLLWAVNQRSLMGERANGPVANLVGGAVVLLTAVLGGTQVWRVFDA